MTRATSHAASAAIAVAVLCCVRPAAADESADESGRGAVDESADESAKDSADPVTEVWREPDVPLELHWHLLALPERAIELAFTPLAVLVTVTERHRIDRRVYDLLRNDAGTIVFNPDLKIALDDGLGVAERSRSGTCSATRRS